jgi:predicted dehydrogenase
MTTPLGIGIVGAGTIARAHLLGIREHGGARAVSVFDTIPERAAAVAQSADVPHVAASLDDLIANPAVDAVIVCTPPGFHHGPTVAALQAGKHVLCEKPLALTVGEAEAMVAAADASGAFLACASARFRCTPPHRAAHEMIERGELGDVYHVRFTSWRARGRPGHHVFPEATWFLDRSLSGGGVLMDFGVYMIDSALWMLGNPGVVSVSAQLRRSTEEVVPEGVRHDVEDHAVLMLRCDGGRAAIIETAWVTNLDSGDGLSILGTKAGMRVDGPSLRKFAVREVGADEFRPTPGLGNHRVTSEPLFAAPEMATGSSYEITKQFISGVRDGVQPQTSGLDALAVTRVIDAAYQTTNVAP